MNKVSHFNCIRSFKMSLQHKSTSRLIATATNEALHMHVCVHMMCTCVRVCVCITSVILTINVVFTLNSVLYTLVLLQGGLAGG